MKNLTENQQEIIDLITSEFVLINEKKATETDDIFAYIDSAVNEKKLYAEEMKQRNAIYEKVIYEKMNSIVDRIDNIVNKYGGVCKFKWESDGIYNINEIRVQKYTEFVICFNGREEARFNFFTDISREMDIKAYDNTNLGIIYYDLLNNSRILKDEELDKHIANIVINRLKREIK